MILYSCDLIIFFCTCSIMSRKVFIRSTDQDEKIQVSKEATKKWYGRKKGLDKVEKKDHPDIIDDMPNYTENNDILGSYENFDNRKKYGIFHSTRKGISKQKFHDGIAGIHEQKMLDGREKIKTEITGEVLNKKNLEDAKELYKHFGVSWGWFGNTGIMRGDLTDRQQRILDEVKKIRVYEANEQLRNELGEVDEYNYGDIALKHRPNKGDITWDALENVYADAQNNVETAKRDGGLFNDNDANEFIIDLVKPLGDKENTKLELKKRVHDMIHEYDNDMLHDKACRHKSSPCLRYLTDYGIPISLILLVLVGIYILYSIMNDDESKQYAAEYGPDYKKFDHARRQYLDNILPEYDSTASYEKTCVNKEYFSCIPSMEEKCAMDKDKYCEKLTEKVNFDKYVESMESLIIDDVATTWDETKKAGISISKDEIKEHLENKLKREMIDDAIQRQKDIEKKKELCKITRVPVPDDVIIKRTSNRGMVCSIVSSLFLGTANGIFDGMGNVNGSTSDALIGMVVGTTIGFIADLYYGSDEGMRIMQKESKGMALRYAFGNIISSKFARYTVTVLLDMMICTMLLDPTMQFLTQACVLHKHEWLALTIASSITGMITFMAYTNQTRFLWAYPSGTIRDKSKLMKSGTVMLATVITSLVYYFAPTGRGLDKREGINQKHLKAIIILLVLGILSALTYFEVVDPKLPYSTDGVVIGYDRITGEKLTSMELSKYETCDKLKNRVRYEYKANVKKAEELSMRTAIERSSLGVNVFLLLALFCTGVTLSSKSSKIFADGNGTPGHRRSDLWKKPVIGILFMSLLFGFTRLTCDMPNDDKLTKIMKTIMKD